jgi:hypothetical protein
VAVVVAVAVAVVVAVVEAVAEAEILLVQLTLLMLVSVRLS